jgi:hypothetical protein
LRRKTCLLIAAAAGISAILATGCVYAKSDGGALLHTWYGTRSQQITDRIHETAAAQGVQAFAQLNERSNGLANDSRKEIATAAKTRIEATAQQLQAAANAYIAQIDDAKTGLTADFALQRGFDNYIDAVTSTSNDELDQLAADTIDELTQQLTTESNP